MTYDGLNDLIGLALDSKRARDREELAHLRYDRDEIARMLAREAEIVGFADECEVDGKPLDSLPLGARRPVAAELRRRREDVGTSPAERFPYGW